MIRGTVNERMEAIVKLGLSGPGCGTELEVVIDTGFNGGLSLESSVIQKLGLKSAGLVEGTLADGTTIDFDAFFAEVAWLGSSRLLAVIGSKGGNLLGMELLENSRLTMDVVKQGVVTIQAIAESEPLT